MDKIAAFNKAAGDAFRLHVLRVLAQDAYGVLELCEIFGYRQSGMSHHLKVLADVGLVTKRREGNTIFYNRAVPAASDSMAALQLQLYTTIDQQALQVGLQDNVERARQRREQLSQQFFTDNAQRFKAQQDLIAEYPAYAAAMEQLLDTITLPAKQLAIEVGPGSGEFLPHLAKQFTQVVAVDNALVMLNKSQHHCETLSNIAFICDNTKALAAYPQQVDCVVMNMVLHHIPSPADVFEDVARCLKPQGVLLLCDLCRHDQDWAKSSCGDIWLGFDADTLKHWAVAAGMQQGYSQYLALRNGFQIQLQQFVKD